ncbi:DUF1351 domain-containing protein [Clostridium beijerinckii]|uniref:DUF1351 domain-containing protein n=1 Tax=Clostridium beijerinckii TaxID=1520 RepID=UPI00098CB8B9|nr:DUF1351 domain-containing protein [Clostridium beijerinckii]NRT76344.1 hypothetical protein [Clostridium beijerinckii]OOM48619.1 hypothetical protein CBEIJ_20910 [Clostridium beijerinckii]
MKDLEVNKELPIIKTNFEEVKQSLIVSMEKYKGIVVIEESLKDCKATQKELAGLRNKIDIYRKTIKKEILVPVTTFECNCKELKKLIIEVENPIKEGISIFDNKRREEKRVKALEYIAESVQTHNLSEKYAKKLNVLDKYLTLTGSLKSIKEDIEQRALMLDQEQDRELSMLQVLQGTIKTANETINTPLNLKDFQNLIDMNYPAVKIIQEINKRAAMIREAEKPKNIEVSQEIKQEPINNPVATVSEIKSAESKEVKNEQLYFYDLKVVANFENMRKLTGLLKNGGFTYTVNDQGKVQN